MAYPQRRSWPSEFDRIVRGGLASSTEARLTELRKWGGFTSFLTPRGLGVGADCGIEPIGQAVGLSGGELVEGWIRTTQPGQGRARVGAPRWRERTGPLRSWDTVRRRALDRLTQQAELLGADAVVAVTARRREFALGVEPPVPEFVFTGTAVRVRGWRRAADAKPTLTMATADELWRLLRAGVEPAGIAGAFASVETRASLSTMSTVSARPNVELPDLTKSFYEARRLAFERLHADEAACRDCTSPSTCLRQRSGDDSRRVRGPSRYSRSEEPRVAARADSAELAGALEVFARKLQGALPNACRVERRRTSLLSRKTRVEAITLDLGDTEFLLRRTGDHLTAERTDHVHDMRKRTERLSLHEWLTALEAELRRRAASGA